MICTRGMHYSKNGQPRGWPFFLMTEHQPEATLVAMSGEDASAGHLTVLRRSSKCRMRCRRVYFIALASALYFSMVAFASFFAVFSLALASFLHWLFSAPRSFLHSASAAS